MFWSLKLGVIDLMIAKGRRMERRYEGNYLYSPKRIDAIDDFDNGTVHCQKSHCRCLLSFTTGPLS
jgi:hypothetical protein